MPSNLPLPLYTRSLVILAVQVVFISALFSFYNVNFPINPIIKWIIQKLRKVCF